MIDVSHGEQVRVLEEHGQDEAHSLNWWGMIFFIASESLCQCSGHSSAGFSAQHSRVLEPGLKVSGRCLHDKGRSEARYLHLLHAIGVQIINEGQVVLAFRPDIYVAPALILVLQPRNGSQQSLNIPGSREHCWFFTSGGRFKQTYLKDFAAHCPYLVLHRFGGPIASCDAHTGRGSAS